MTPNPADEAADTAAALRLFQHGGDINSARRAFPEAATPWIDLSTGINPVPYPLPPLPAELWTLLPAPGELESLQVAAGLRYGVAPDSVVAAPGAQSLIQWLPRLFSAPRVAILSPTYGGHETAWRASGAEVDPVDSVEALEGARRAVLVNPNNPDGRLLPRRRVLALAQAIAARGGVTIVDESFMDLEADSVAPDLAPSTVVLRSFGKFYGLAGLRLGFAIARPDIAARFREALGSWPISGAAIEIGRLALGDTGWLDVTRERLQVDGAWLDRQLIEAGFEIAGSAPLFRLARHAQARTRFARLCRAGVLTRPFAAREDLLRFGVPRLADRKRVRLALEALRSPA